ncbi:MAG: MBL fold metallo-hydrolase [Bradymonadaceae bacterium]|nr:MBL fold metallo-hydrolase [Lujinxingiaceae bacterium]
MHLTHKLADDVIQISLSKPAGLAQPAGRSNNVYLLLGEACALINAGHPSQFQSLLAAIREAGITPAHIERVIYTSWDVDMLAGASNFLQADHFVFSADMVEPTSLEKHVDAQREAFRATARQLRDHIITADGADLGSVEAFIAAYYPPVTEQFKGIPLRGGHFVRAGNLELEVLATPGPTAGHACLYSADRKWLFSGNFSMAGLPEEIVEVQAYLIGLERLMKLSVERLLPAFGQAYERGNWTLGRALRFMNHFLSSAPSALVQGPTVLEFIERDLGYRPDDLVELVFAFRKYRALFDELVRTHNIEARGIELARRYGTDIDDPRASIRRR